MEGLSEYRYDIDRAKLAQLMQEEAWAASVEMLAEPLHEALYKRQSFDLLDELSTTERLILAFDYVQGQVGQGGFIQLIQNGYVSLLVVVVEALQEKHMCAEMSSVLDNALKVYVLNQDILGRETTVKEFGKLYEEFKEFEGLEERFTRLLGGTSKAIVLSTVSLDR